MRRVLVTGASRGIGLEFVRQFLERGDPHFAACRDPENAHPLQAYASDRLHLITLDVADERSIESSYAVVRAQTDALDVLVNNAGIANDDDELGSLTFENLLHILRINAVAPMLIAQRYLDLLRRGTTPKLVGVTSEYASLALKPDGGPFGYSASKAALNMFMRTLAFEAGGVTTILVDPGWVQTDMGGSDASLTPQQSVDGMIAVIEAVGQEHNGGFYRWDGELMPW
ncbi:MAG: SDR family oxidoreductase [Anaerolineae bacterium]|nr:SDR family oxidoreductase [Anaerolineae bacterium]